MRFPTKKIHLICNSHIDPVWMRMTVLRSAIYADHFAQRDEHNVHMEQGIHAFTYSLYPHRSNAASERRAAELNFGLRRMLGSFHKGSLPEKWEQYPEIMKIASFLL